MTPLKLLIAGAWERCLSPPWVGEGQKPHHSTSFERRQFIRCLQAPTQLLFWVQQASVSPRSSSATLCGVTRILPNPFEKSANLRIEYTDSAIPFSDRYLMQIPHILGFRFVSKARVASETLSTCLKHGTPHLGRKGIEHRQASTAHKLYKGSTIHVKSDIPKTP